MWYDGIYEMMTALLFYKSKGTGFDDNQYIIITSV